MYSTLNVIKDFLWDQILVYALLGVGIFFTFYLGLPQILRIGSGFRKTFGGLFRRGRPTASGEVSSFQALATAIAAQVGTGNIGGVASAILSGGPGAVFWMWVSGILGMATIFAEAVLAQIYRRRNGDSYYGGPAYYLTAGLKNKTLGRILAVAFSFFIIIALGFFGNAVQSNSMALAMQQGFNVPPVAVGIVVALLVGAIVMGGIQRISRTAELVVPIMALLFIGASLSICYLYRQNIGPSIAAIFRSAFSTQAIYGGAVGISVKTAIKYGLARGLFSNEAGMGSTPHAHAVADVKHPCEQGLIAMVGVVIDTLVICTLTALTILVTDAHLIAHTQGITSVAVTQLGFGIALGGIGHKFLAVSLMFFAFTTVIGWYYFGESNVIFLFGKKALLPYRVIVLGFLILGTLIDVEKIWMLSDLMNPLMAIPNLIGIIFLSSIVKKSFAEYRELERRK